MQRLILILLILIASVWMGVEMAKHPGYVLLAYGQWIVEMPLWVAFLSVGVAFLVFYWVLNIFSGLRHLNSRLSGWLKHRRRYKSYDKTNKGLLEVMEEQWVYAEKHLLEGVYQSQNPVINYLAAAHAAYAQKAIERSDTYLQKAYQISPQDEVVIGLVQAKFQLEQGQMEQAMTKLKHLHQLVPYHSGVLKLLEKMYIRLSDWQNLLGLLPFLRKAKVMNVHQVLVFEKNIYCEMLDDAERKNMSIHAVRELWQIIPKKIRMQPDILERYATLLKEDKCSAEEIEPLIRKLLNKEWQDSLVKIYGSLLTTDPLRQLTAAESWVKHYGKRNSLLLTLGRLALRCQLWGKAKQYLEEGLKQQDNSETQLELAQLFEKLGETQLALRHYKDGLVLAMG